MPNFSKGELSMNAQSTRQQEETHHLLKLKYQSVLGGAKNFLKNRTKTKNRSSCSSIRVNWLIACEAECPHCGLRFRGGNHNTEHIHPISLGGTNNNDNRIQLCKNCNNARNSVMQALLGHSPFSKIFPQEWDAVERYLLWSEITIDEGLSSGARFPEVHELFLEARFAGESPVSGPKKAFGRLSTWGVGEEPNYIGNTAALRSAHTNTTTGTISSFLRRKARLFFDRLFDYESPTNTGQTTSSPLREEVVTGQSAVDESKVLPKVTQGEQKSNQELSETEVSILRQKWKDHALNCLGQNDGSFFVGDFWQLVSDERIARGLSWRSFERALSVTHKAAMPSKVRQILEQIGLNFIFEKTEDGYLIVEASEEE